MYLLRFVLKWGEGSPLFLFLPPPSNKVDFANGEFTASLQALSELPASIWTGERDVEEPNASPLGSFLRHEFRPPPWCPFTVSALPLLLLCRFFFPTALCHVHTPQTPVMQYDLFSYQLLTLSTISDSCWHQHTQAKVFRCAPAVSRWDKPVLRPTLQDVLSAAWDI